MIFNANHVAVAEVIDGVSTDIRHRSAGGYSPKDTMRLTIKIAEVLETNPNLLPTDEKHPLFKELPISYPIVGEIIEVDASVSNHVPQTGVKVVSSRELGMGRILIEPPTGQLLSDDEIKAAFVGKRFVFGISGNYYTLPNQDPLKRPFEYIVKYHANMWPLETGDVIKAWLFQFTQNRTRRY